MHVEAQIVVTCEIGIAKFTPTKIMKKMMAIESRVESQINEGATNKI